MSITIKIEQDGEVYSGVLGTVESTQLGYEGHGILTAYLTFKLANGGHVAVGGYNLNPPGQKALDAGERGNAFCADHIAQILNVFGANDWEKIKGKQCVVVFDGDGGLGARAVGLASITNEKRVLILQERMRMWVKQ